MRSHDTFSIAYESHFDDVVDIRLREAAAQGDRWPRLRLPTGDAGAPVK